jgi:hypothetical protein
MPRRRLALLARAKSRNHRAAIESDVRKTA